MRRTLNELAGHVGGHVIGDGTRSVTDVAPFEAAGPDHLALAGSPKYLKRLSETGAGALVVPPKADTGDRDGIAVANPAVAFARITQLFHPRAEVRQMVSPLAHVGEGVRWTAPVSVGPGVSLGRDVTLGARVRLHPGVVVEDGASIGDDAEIYPNVVIRSGCLIGNRVIIHPGAVIGADGFGFAPDGREFHKIPHLGIVQIDDDVEIGANATIDRATFGRTWIQRGVKIDNLVHLAHNVVVGENTVIVAQVGVSGSTRIGANAILAGQAGLAGHLTIGNRVTVGPQCGVGRDIPDGEIVSGSPEMPHRVWLRAQALVPKLPELKKTVTEIEKRLKALEDSHD